MVHVSLANYEVQMSRGNSQAFFMDYTVAISVLLVPIPTRYYIIVAFPVPWPLSPVLPIVWSHLCLSHTEQMNLGGGGLCRVLHLLHTLCPHLGQSAPLLNTLPSLASQLLHCGWPSSCAWWLRSCWISWRMVLWKYMFWFHTCTQSYWDNLRRSNRKDKVILSQLSLYCWVHTLC